MLEEEVLSVAQIAQFVADSLQMVAIPSGLFEFFPKEQREKLERYVQAMAKRIAFGLSPYMFGIPIIIVMLLSLLPILFPLAIFVALLRAVFYGNEGDSLSPERCRSGPKTRYEASGAGASALELSSTGGRELLLATILIVSHGRRHGRSNEADRLMGGDHDVCLDFRDVGQKPSRTPLVKEPAEGSAPA